ncbi:hypothetical protein STRTUCAR8_10005 [Streptomyces turgidiscabies Car8]|uniref:Uncharacterized protein n=1 Tax=Streptomyces turgidiscabies (strain Car8) TaxID=698760 RepID=L7F9H3_STRT8|nr:hypothetical protein STRTUCAR8_10005 [Streptomyces turgidiscabies Car8]
MHRERELVFGEGTGQLLDEAPEYVLDRPVGQQAEHNARAPRPPFAPAMRPAL